MNEYVAKITLDLNCQATPIVISAGQYDIGRQIKINLTADGEAYDATGATAVCKGKSGSNYFAVNATVAKNIVTVTTDKAMLSSAGRTVAKIVLTDGTRTYSTQPFVINTHSDYDGDITTSDYYPELLDILSRVIALTESGAVLTDTALDAKSVNPVQNKVLTAIINNKANKATTLAGYGITDAYTKDRTDQKLAQKLNSMPFDSEPKNNSPCYLTSGTVYKALLSKSDSNSVYSKAETDNSLGNKADLVNSSNIFDFNKWAGGLQNLTNSVFRGTLDEVDFAKKTIKFTATVSGAYTNGWDNSPAEMIIAVKPKTVYTFSWHFEGSEKTRIYLFLNGKNTDEARLTKGGKAEYLTFTTLEDTSFITIRFDAVSAGTTVTVSKIMIEEGNKSLLYIPHAVAEGVNELAQSTNTALSEVNNTLDLKYDSANIESGTSTLTPYSTVTDKIKSANCTYKTIGDIVIVSATVKMNAVSLGGNSMCPLIDLPYKCISEDNVFCVGISNLGKLFKFAIPKNNTWLQFSTQDKTAYTFADGEQINVICLYKIK